MNPLVSVILLTYNQRHTVEEALNSILSQTYSPLEIVISDDHSVDDTWENITHLVSSYNGPHRIQLNRNSRNLGINANYNKAFSIAQGELILIAAGDDISLPERAAVTVEHWLSAGQKPRLIAAPVIDMYEDGSLGKPIEVTDLAKVHSLHDWLRTKPYVIGAGHAWHRSLFHDFSPLPTELTHEDQIASYRAALLDGGMTLDTPLVKYRRGGATYKTISRSCQDWLEKRRLDAMRDAAFWRQMSIDMVGFSVDEADRRQVLRHLARCTYESSMIETSNLAGQLKVFLCHPRVDLVFRVRTFLNVYFAAAIFTLKIARRQNKS